MRATNYIVTILLLTVVAVGNANAQTSKPAPPETKQFDFWIGEWDVEWKDQSSGEMKRGINSIKFILGGNVIEENFTGTPDINLIGKSWSMYHAPEKRWHQTWVDDQGGLILFTGEVLDDGRRIFATEVKDNKTNRMVFYDIKKNSFMWEWQVSNDGGKKWGLAWRVKYTRKDTRK